MEWSGACGMGGMELVIEWVNCSVVELKGGVGEFVMIVR